jgi:hypothetical protein
MLMKGRETREREKLREQSSWKARRFGIQRTGRDLSCQEEECFHCLVEGQALDPGGYHRWSALSLDAGIESFAESEREVKHVGKGMDV